jgi:hypothetical protein
MPNLLDDRRPFSQISIQQRRLVAAQPRPMRRTSRTRGSTPVRFVKPNRLVNGFVL